MGKRCTRFLGWACAVGCLVSGGSAAGQTRSRPHSATQHTASRAAHRHPSPPSVASQPPQPPAVKLEKGELTVDAHNSELSAILDEVARRSGMTVDGQGSGARVFGVYGPGSPRQVLTELLEGAGYNFMMVGGAPDGTPRELLLTARTRNQAAPAAPPSAASSSDEESDDQEPPGPGAIVHVPPSVAQQADDSQTQQRVQQQIQRLQQMHDAEQKQQENQPQ